MMCDGSAQAGRQGGDSVGVVGTEHVEHVEARSAGPAARPSPPALRLRRPGWRDPRLLLGVVLLALSVALGSWAVGEAGRTTPVLVAGDTLVPGASLADGVQVREVRMPGAVETYLTPADDLTGLVVGRQVGRGELVPRAAVASETDLGLRPVTLNPRRALPAAMTTGSTVELWHVPVPEAEATPELLVRDVTVTQVADGGGTFSIGSGTTVHVLVPVDDLPTVLAALAGDGTVEVVQVPGGTAAP